MATGTITPAPYEQEIDANGEPISGALIYTYLAGTSTPATTWTTVNVSGGSAVPNTNPIVADSAGRWVAFLQSGVSYKYVYCLPVSPIPPPSSPPSAYKTVDNILAVPGETEALDVSGVLGEPVLETNLLYLSDGSGAKTAGKWYLGSSLNAYSSTTPEMGFAVSAGTTNDTIFIRQGGRVTGLSGLAAGAAYYAGTAGAITAAPSMNARFVGQADSTTSLVVSPNPPPLTSIDNGICDFRLTLTTSVPVTVTDVTGATTIFCAPYKGNRLALYDASGIATIYTSVQFSIAVPATTTQMYDIFGYANAGVPTLELLAWTNDTARATAIVQTTTGAWTKSGDLTRRYLGSFRTTGISGQTEDSVTKRYLWNYYNRVLRQLLQNETTATWTYSTATWRQQRATATNQVEIVQGVAESMFWLRMRAAASNDTGGDIFATVGIGEDSTSAPVSAAAVGIAQLVTATASYPVTAELDKVPPIGYHKYVALEAVAALGATTWYGASTTTAGTRTTTGTGLSGWIVG